MRATDGTTETISVSYEDLVASLIEEHDTPMTSVLGWLKFWGVELHGDVTVYWPAKHYVLDWDLSPRVVEILRKLADDPRLFFSPQVADARFLTTLEPLAGDGTVAALLPSGKPKKYKRDHKFLISVHATKEAYAASPYRDHEFDREEARYIYVESTYSEKIERLIACGAARVTDSI
jgi:hypothetical protein